MCAVFALLSLIDIRQQNRMMPADVATFQENLKRRWTHIIQQSEERGRDGSGTWTSEGLEVSLGNHRAEPTTEYQKLKGDYDQQPYKQGDWVIVHNGTIANDADLRECVDVRYPSNIDTAAIIELLDMESRNDYAQNPATQFEHVVRMLKGSYAILAYNVRTPGTVYYATNYKPIWFQVTDDVVYFASSETYFSDRFVYPPAAINQYTVGRIAAREGEFHIESNSLYVDNPERQQRALVICSGGLDSTVAAALTKARGDDVTLLHYHYGCRAGDKETAAVHAIANRLEVPLVTLALPSIYNTADSPLFSTTPHFATGESGAEFAHEWVPARNLLMLSVATAYAEANRYDVIVLGNNLEEAGAYPDNEPEFIHRFRKLLPYAVGDGKRVQIAQPVGSLMKHEIVRIGMANGAPLDLTWSCYNNLEKHCGKCGPCYMRRKAFYINRIPEVIKYEDDEL